MNTEPKKIKVEYHHEEPGNCLACFKGIGEDFGKWFNKMFDGTWYYTFPSQGYFENSHKVQVPCVFLIYGKGLAKAFAVDSNVPELAENPYVFRDKMLAELREKYLKVPGNIDYNEWAREICDCDEFRGYKGYRDNFLHYDQEVVTEDHLETIRWAGRHHDVVRRLYRNKISDREYWEYIVKMRYVGVFTYEQDESLTVYSFHASKQPV